MSFNSSGQGSFGLPLFALFTSPTPSHSWMACVGGHAYSMRAVTWTTSLNDQKRPPSVTISLLSYFHIIFILFPISPARSSYTALSLDTKYSLSLSFTLRFFLFHDFYTWCDDISRIGAAPGAPRSARERASGRWKKSLVKKLREREVRSLLEKNAFFFLPFRFCFHSFYYFILFYQ